MNAWFRRWAYLGIAPGICLVLYWRVFFTWFLNDDFAWLGLPLQVSRPHNLWQVLFAPAAQGTVRFLSERLFFLIFSALFGFHALPYRIWIFGTWFADLTLATLIGSRLTRSRAAGVLSAVLWTLSVRMITPLAWASAYNEVACAFFILAAFYARLRRLEGGGRKWAIAEWSAYLAGFGALEVMVMYPVLVVLYSFMQPTPERARQPGIWPLFIPAALFTAIHFFLIPKTSSPIYVLKVDWRLPLNFLHYLAWSTSSSRVESGEHWYLKDLVVPVSVTLGLAAFLISRLRRREFTAVFCFGWFVLLLAPMLPLPNHVSDYYLAIPVAGLAWLGGWAIVASWDGGRVERAIAAGLAAVYLVGCAQQINYSTRWYQERAARMRTVVLGLREQAQLHPGSAFLLEGVDNDLYHSGFEDDPFRLLGLNQVYLAADARGLQPRTDLDAMSRFIIAPERALGLLKSGQARALSISAKRLNDVTPEYENSLISGTSVLHQFVDVGDPVYSWLLGPTWHPRERGFRWMPRTATVRLSGPKAPRMTLHVTGFAPEALFATGLPVLHFRIGEREIGTATVRKPEGFTLDFPTPADLANQAEVEISIEVSKALHPASEQRELGMVFGTFEFR